MVYLVYGAPCSGKSTYIKEHMTYSDVVCDVDLIYQAISGNDPHEADLWVHEMALKLYYSLLDMIKEREGGFKDAYVVSIASTDEEVRNAMDRVRADKAVFIDTPRGVCLQRADERKDSDAFKLLIEEWFATRGNK